MNRTASIGSWVGPAVIRTVGGLFSLLAWGSVVGGIKVSVLDMNGQYTVGAESRRESGLRRDYTPHSFRTSGAAVGRMSTVASGLLADPSSRRELKG